MTTNDNTVYEMKKTKTKEEKQEIELEDRYMEYEIDL